MDRLAAARDPVAGGRAGRAARRAARGLTGVTPTGWRGPARMRASRWGSWPASTSVGCRWIASIFPLPIEGTLLLFYRDPQQDPAEVTRGVVGPLPDLQPPA